MTALLRLELARLIAAPRSWWLLAAAALTLAWPFLSAVDALLAAQERLPELPAPVTRLVAAPALARAAVLIALLGVLLAPRWWALDRAEGLDALYRGAAGGTGAVVAAKWLAAVLLLSVPAVLAGLMGVSLRFGAPVDLGTLAAGVLGLVGLALPVAAAGLVASVLARNALVAALLCGLLLAALWAPDAPAIARGDFSNSLALVSVTRRLHPLLNGELAVATLVVFAAGSAVFLAVAWARLSRRPIAHRTGAVALIVAGGVAAVAGAERGDWRFDLSASQRHTFAAETRSLLAGLPGTLEVFVPDDEGVPWRAVNTFLDRVRASHPALEVHPVSPARQPERWQTLAMQPNQLLLRLDEREARIEALRELDFAAAISRLIAGREARVAYLAGDGGRDLRDPGPLAWGRLGRALADRGMPPVPLDVVLTPVLPLDLDLLVLAPGSGEPIPGAVEAVLRWLDDGAGALLWAADPGSHSAWEPLVAALGLERLPGVVVDARAADRGEADPRMLQIARPAGHPALAGVAGPVVLPRTAAWRLPVAGEWRHEGLLASTDTSWNETGWSEAGDLSGALAPGGNGEQRGPLWVAVALEREAGDRRQRVVVLGDGDFAANRFIGLGANQDLALGLAGWLLERDALAGVTFRPEPDLRLELGRGGLGALGIFWLFIVPVLLAIPGIGLRRRRRA